jgi:hypothetical protein
MGVAHGHVSRQGPSIRLWSAGSTSATLLPGPVADAWSDSWVLAAACALHRCRHPSGAALAKPLRWPGPLRDSRPRRSLLRMAHPHATTGLGDAMLLGRGRRRAGLVRAVSCDRLESGAGIALQRAQ